MNTRQAIIHMMDESGVSGAALSAVIGRDRNAVSTILSRGTTPRVDTLAKIAGAMGYKLMLVSDDDRVTIDPPAAGE